MVSKSINTYVNNIAIFILVVISDEIQNYIVWLENNNDPGLLQKIIEYWKLTSEYRIKQIKYANQSLTDVIKSWPCYGDSIGYQLVSDLILITTQFF